MPNEEPLAAATIGREHLLEQEIITTRVGMPRQPGRQEHERTGPPGKTLL